MGIATIGDTTINVINVTYSTKADGAGVGTGKMATTITET